MNSRDILINLISDGIDTSMIGDNSDKSILVRGCDPEMGKRAMELLPPILGNPEMYSVTNDDDFISNYKENNGQLFTLHEEPVDMMRQNHLF